MFKFTYTGIILLFFLTSCTDRIITINEDDLPEDIFYYEEEIKPYSGICRIMYESGAVKEELSFENGILQGPGLSYYPDSTLKRSGFYVNGYLQGKWQYFNKEGKKIMEIHFSNDTMDGYYVSWYCTGVIKEKGIYKKNKRVGEWIFYDEAGMITEQSYY